MNIFNYNDKDNPDVQQDYCENCNVWSAPEDLHPHHIKHKRNSEDCIWLCFVCHREAHDNTGWAKEKGIIQTPDAEDNAYKKRSRNKKCEHKKTIYDAKIGDFVCMFCKSVVGSFKSSSLKLKQIQKKPKVCTHYKTIYMPAKGTYKCIFCSKILDAPKFGKSKPQQKEFKKQPSVKMGSEQIDPRILEAEKLKSRMRVVTALMKKHVDDNQKYKELLLERNQIHKQMVDIKSSYEDNF